MDLVASEWIQNSSTSSLHIALAVSTEETINDNLERMLYYSCGIFQLKLLDIAFMKTKPENFEGSVHCNALPPFDCSQPENWLHRHMKYITSGNDVVMVVFRDSTEQSDCFTIK